MFVIMLQGKAPASTPCPWLQLCKAHACPETLPATSRICPGHTSHGNHPCCAHRAQGALSLWGSSHLQVPLTTAGGSWTSCPPCILLGAGAAVTSQHPNCAGSRNMDSHHLLQKASFITIATFVISSGSQVSLFDCDCQKRQSQGRGSPFAEQWEGRGRVSTTQTKWGWL